MKGLSHHAATVRARLAGAAGVIANRRLRSEVLTRLALGNGMHQISSLTCEDRYPVLFRAAAHLLQDRPEPRLLSYGCASGEEVASLHRYFPGAAITGVEINRFLLRLCRKRWTDPAFQFAAPGDPEIAARGPYDAIFCMAVLTRRPHEIERRAVRDISRLYPFARFARQVRELAGLLAPGGYLVVEHALYRVEDAIEGCGLVPVAGHGLALAKGPRFAADGSLIAPQPVIARIFRRTP